VHDYLTFSRSNFYAKKYRDKSKILIFALFIFFILLTMAEFYQTDAPMTNYSGQTYVLIVIDPTEQPVEIKDGLSKLINYAPHSNLVSENAMGDVSSEFYWHVK
jgi:hypothetical protein